MWYAWFFLVTGPFNWNLAVTFDLLQVVDARELKPYISLYNVTGLRYQYFCSQSVESQGHYDLQSRSFYARELQRLHALRLQYIIIQNDEVNIYFVVEILKVKVAETS